VLSCAESDTLRNRGPCPEARHAGKSPGGARNSRWCPLGSGTITGWLPVHHGRITGAQPAPAPPAPAATRRRVAAQSQPTYQRHGRRRWPQRQHKPLRGSACSLGAPAGRLGRSRAATRAAKALRQQAAVAHRVVISDTRARTRRRRRSPASESITSAADFSSTSPSINAEILSSCLYHLWSFRVPTTPQLLRNGLARAEDARAPCDLHQSTLGCPRSSCLHSQLDRRVLTLWSFSIVEFTSPRFSKQHAYRRVIRAAARLRRTLPPRRL